jgi:hypothetical protein
MMLGAVNGLRIWNFLHCSRMTKNHGKRGQKGWRRLQHKSAACNKHFPSDNKEKNQIGADDCLLVRAPTAFSSEQQLLEFLLTQITRGMPENAE